MQTYTNAFKILAVAMLVNIATPVFAQSAPVYDVDSMQQDDGGIPAAPTDQAQDYPPPPPPERSEAGGAFVPVQPNISSVPAPSSPPLSMEQRVQRVEQQVNNMQTSDAATRVESLQDQVQALRGQIETLTHQLEQLQTQQKTMYSDLDNRLALAGTKSASANPPAPAANTNLSVDGDTDTANAAVKSDTRATAKAVKQAQVNVPVKANVKPSTSQPDVAEEQQIYQTAYNLIKAKKYSDAVSALQGMLKKYPSGQFASNAHYWLGELYGLMGKNDLALTEFSTVVQTYPDSPRVSDAQLKVGLLLASQLKWPDAKAAFKRVINHYPGSASARLAAEQLKQIKLAGH
jgi:tol-pal system protein YbgF